MRPLRAGSNHIFKPCFIPSFIPAYGILLLAFPHCAVRISESSFIVTHQARLVIVWTGVREQVCVLKISELQSAGWASRYAYHHINHDLYGNTEE